MDCVHGGSNCPFTSFEDFFGWFVSSTKLKVLPDNVDISLTLHSLFRFQRKAST